MNATLEITKGVLIPFVGTSLGAVCAIFMKKQLVSSLQRVLSGFAAGVMVAASVWSLLLPAIDQASSYSTWAFIPAALGFWLGVFFLLFLNRAIPRLRTDSGESGGLFGRTKRTAMLVLAVTIHNIPEGMAVGAVYAGYRAGSFGITSMAAFTLALGIAIQNIPEGAIISMPLCDEALRLFPARPSNAIFFKLCRGRHVLCRRQGADSRDDGGRLLRHRHCFFRLWLHADDGAGRRAGMNIKRSSER